VLKEELKLPKEPPLQKPNANQLQTNGELSITILINKLLNVTLIILEATTNVLCVLRFRLDALLALKEKTLLNQQPAVDAKTGTTIQELILLSPVPLALLLLVEIVNLVHLLPAIPAKITLTIVLQMLLPQPAHLVHQML
jgi:hypothetical protein